MRLTTQSMVILHAVYVVGLKENESYVLLLEPIQFSEMSCRIVQYCRIVYFLYHCRLT